MGRKFPFHLSHQIWVFSRSYSYAITCQMHEIFILDLHPWNQSPKATAAQKAHTFFGWQGSLLSHCAVLHTFVCSLRDQHRATVGNIEFNLTHRNRQNVYAPVLFAFGQCRQLYDRELVSPSDHLLGLAACAVATPVPQPSRGTALTATWQAGLPALQSIQPGQKRQPPNTDKLPGSTGNSHMDSSAVQSTQIQECLFTATSSLIFLT